MDMTKIYFIIGFLVVMNLGTIASVLVGVGKLIWWLSALNKTVEGHTKDINAAHEKMRELRESIKRGI